MDECIEIIDHCSDYSDFFRRIEEADNPITRNLGLVYLGLAGIFDKNVWKRQADRRNDKPHIVIASQNGTFGGAIVRSFFNESDVFPTLIEIQQAYGVKTEDSQSLEIVDGAYQLDVGESARVRIAPNETDLFSNHPEANAVLLHLGVFEDYHDMTDTLNVVVNSTPIFNSDSDGQKLAQINQYHLLL